MKLTKIFSLVILTLCTAIYGFFENQKIIYKNSSFIVSTNLNIDKDSVDTINIEKQLEIVDTVFNWLLCPDFKDSLPKPLLVYMTKLDGLISFQSKSSDRVVTIDNNNMVKKIWNTPCARKITEIEYEYFRKHNKLIPGMKIISEQDAIKEARTFFTKLLRYYDLQGDISNYDSVIVNLHLGHNCYVVRFLAKIKNYIRDNREAKISVSPINGQILHYYTPMGLLLNKNLNYKPNFEYDQVEELIEELKKSKKLHMSQSRGLLLQPFHRQWKKWVWVLTGLKDSTSYYASYLVVDSETGEILTNQFADSVDEK